jgi:SAM-dependent methyltransferase
MVQEYNTRVGQSTTVLEISASVGNFLDPTNSSPEGFESEEFHNFDLAAVGLGFHYFEDPILAATRLAARLKEGGCLLIIDFILNEKSGEGGEGEGDRKGNGNGHRHCHGFGKHHGCGNGDAAVAQTKRRLGFGEEEMRDIFRSAGVGKDFDFEVIAKGAMFETPSCSMIQDVFMARGTKA